MPNREQPDDSQPQTSRRGAEAKGGTAPQPGDPTSPAEASARAAELDRALREGGFGDHKGASIDRRD